MYPDVQTVLGRIILYLFVEHIIYNDSIPYHQTSTIQRNICYKEVNIKSSCLVELSSFGDFKSLLMFAPVILFETANTLFFSMIRGFHHYSIPPCVRAHTCTRTHTHTLSPFSEATSPRCCTVDDGNKDLLIVSLKPAMPFATPLLP